ncbi:MAG: CCA tRNA nucleotidyltransferase [Bacteroidales bacterium]|nr:CCA tRNA nucleotidyltransferase [Bacteroidales bacterium]
MNSKIYSAIVDYLRKTIAGTEWEGHIFTVGGCVRDSYLGNPIKDVDLAIDLPMGSIKFAEWLHHKRLTAGKPINFFKFGTSKFRLKAFRDVEIEAVQTRKGRYDAGNADCPETVFGSILEDARRRDLTINSLYYDISRDQILDPLGTGIADLDARRLNTPLRPRDTFEDDPVRMIRVIRFHSRLGWPLGKNIYEAMRPYVDGLAQVSGPRLGGEFFKSISEPRIVETIDAFKDLGIFHHALPALEQQLQALPDSWDEIRKMTQIYEAQNDPDAEVMMAILLHRIGLSKMSDPGEELERLGIGLSHASSKLAKAIVKVMKVDRNVTNEIGFLISNQNRLRNAGADGSGFRDRQLHGLINAAVTPERLEKLLRFIDILNQATNPELCGQVDAIRSRVKAYYERHGLPAAPSKPAKHRRRGAKPDSDTTENKQPKKKSRKRWRPRRHIRKKNKDQ